MWDVRIFSKKRERRATCLTAHRFPNQQSVDRRTVTNRRTRMTSRSRWVFFALVGLAAMFGPVANNARANTLYGITFSNKLITINPTTGAGTLVGNFDSSMAPYGLAV